MAAAIHLYDLKSSGPHPESRKKAPDEERGGDECSGFKAVPLEPGDLCDEDRETRDPEQRREHKSCAKEPFQRDLPGPAEDEW